MSRVVLHSLCTALLLVGCARVERAGTDSVSTTPAASGGPAYAYERVPLDTSRPPGTIIDSVFPMPEMIRRFREGLPATDRFTGGASSREELVQAFVNALAARDKQSLALLTLSRAEYAYLYLPSVPELTRANGLPPQRQWDQLVLTSEQGIARALDRLGGKPLSLKSLTCPETPVRLGSVERIAGCVVKVSAADGSTVFDGHLFGSIVQVGGRFKFTSYANDM